MHDGARLAAPEDRPLGCGDPATCAGHRPDANCGDCGKGDAGNTLGLTVAILARRWAAHLDEVLAEAGFGVGQLAVLTLLQNRPAGLTQREAADLLAVSEAVMSTRTAALLSAGLVSRQTLIGDRRAHLLQITAEGRSAHDVWSKCLSCVQEQILESVGAEDLAVTQRTLAKIGAAVERLSEQEGRKLKPAPRRRPPAASGPRA